MKMYLTEKERTTYLKQLSKEQRKTLFLVIGKSYQSYFADVLAKHKGTKDWKFHLYIDHGGIKKGIKCVCGRPLRHQYILINKKTKEKRTLGRTHFLEELNIPENIALEITKGINDINYELDEILQRYHDRWELFPFIKESLNDTKIPRDIERLIEMKLPLSNRQVRRLKEIVNKKEGNKKIERNIFETPYGEVEVKNEEIYKVLSGKVDGAKYIGKFDEIILQYLKKHKRYTPIYEIIDQLIKNGLPNEIIYGRHALTKLIHNYLSNKSNIKWVRRDPGFTYYKLVR